MPQYDDRDDLAALDFSTTESGADTLEQSDALDFSTPQRMTRSRPSMRCTTTRRANPRIWTPTSPRSSRRPKPPRRPARATRKSPRVHGDQSPETVSVSALMDGRTQRVELSPKVTSMSETELAEEILVIADLARQKGLAAQHSYLLGDDSLSETMREMGIDGNDVVRDFMENGIGLTTPEQAAAAQAEVFATRYSTDK